MKENQENNPKETSGNDIIHEDNSSTKIVTTDNVLVGSFSLNKKNYTLFKNVFYSTVKFVVYNEMRLPEVFIIAVGNEDNLRNLYSFLNKHKLSGMITINKPFMVETEEGELVMAEVFKYDGKIENNPDAVEILDRIKRISMTHTIVSRDDGTMDYCFYIEKHNLPKLEKIVEYFNAKMEKESLDNIVEELCHVL